MVSNISVPHSPGLCYDPLGADLLGALRGDSDFDRTGIPCNYMLAARWYVALLVKSA